jgi:tetratricopeptide (TPR) repeat protein
MNQPLLFPSNLFSRNDIFLLRLNMGGDGANLSAIARGATEDHRLSPRAAWANNHRSQPQLDRPLFELFHSAILIFYHATLLGILFALLCAPTASHASTNDLFVRGMELSKDGEYPEAVAAFTESAKGRPAAGTLVNLGLAEWNRGHAGAAILAWEQAQWIDPFDARAESNLQFARQVVEVDAPQLKWYETASTWLPPNAWVWIAGATLWLAIGVLVLPRFFRQPRAGWHQTLAAFAFCACIFSVTANLGVISRTDIGFVIKKTAPLLLTPTSDGEVVSSLNAGEAARQLRTRGDYYLIRTASTTGWIEKTQFGLVCPGK